MSDTGGGHRASAQALKAGFEELYGDAYKIVPVRVLRQRIRNGLQKAINFATVVTDLTRCHNTWYYHRVDRCFVATEASKRQALDMGLKVK
ncbi:putative monogalactosyldiacylglycerol synthase, chloroplastic [Auxenochlorella protothecoides]|uniref:Putative monogalactosyldiacylglycerol synthase, chloroplastic n=1 Tax=Auxenochlorella protothecoides TaxID=3075 RepID=A0A087SJ59_AUXPR|nr:putative monogalactosyldiacylglycerol synthase, chloroplastic [Auxenochlorella protothecoides]KFM25763.1 putative monogalactosyldiacylglycerol synthase, chloroplastic [Auxenochlorella protothecoides]